MTSKNNPPPPPSFAQPKKITKEVTIKKGRGRPRKTVSHVKKGESYPVMPMATKISSKTIAERKAEKEARDAKYAELSRFIGEYGVKYRFKTMVGPNASYETITNELNRLYEAKSMIVGTERVEDLAIMLFRGLEFLSGTPANIFNSDLRGLGDISYLKIKGLKVEGGHIVKASEKYAEDVIKDLKIKYPWMTKQPLFLAVIASIVGLCGEVHAINTGIIQKRMLSPPSEADLKKYETL